MAERANFWQRLWYGADYVPKKRKPKEEYEDIPWDSFKPERARAEQHVKGLMRTPGSGVTGGTIKTDETGVGVFLNKPGKYKNPPPPRMSEQLKQPSLTLPGKPPATFGSLAGPQEKVKKQRDVVDREPAPLKANTFVGPPQDPSPLNIPGIQLDNLQTKTPDSTPTLPQSPFQPNASLGSRAARPAAARSRELPQMTNSVGDPTTDFAVNTLGRLGVHRTATFDDIRASANPQQLMSELQQRVPNQLHQQEILEAIQDAERQTGVPAHLLLSLARTESNFNAAAVSRTGAKGMFQFTGGTGRDFGLVGAGFDDRADVRKSALAAAKHLKRDAERFGGNIGLALMAYNAGPNAVARALEQFAAGQTPDTRALLDAVDGDAEKLGVIMADMAQESDE